MDSANTNRPNIIWILGDQHRAQATGYAGDPNVHTPNLDRLAAEGMVFTRAVSGSPLCSPFRGSMLTGRYPHHCVPGHQMPLPAGQPTVASVFRENGYHTAYFGKWHVGGFVEGEKGRAAFHIVPPDRRGDFDTWVGYENNNSQWDTWVHGGEGDTAFHYRLPGYEADAFTGLFIDFLRQQSQPKPEEPAQPFFAVLSVQPPHDPYVAPAEWMQRHTPGTVQLRQNVPAVPRVVERARRELAGYYSMIENLDWNVGRILAELHERNLINNTYLLFFADHGDMLGSQGQFRKTAPWEEAIRIPFIISGGSPMYSGINGRCDAPVNHVDIAPTTLGLCGIAAPDWMSGTDLSAYRLGPWPEGPTPDSAYLQIVVPTGHLDSVDRAWRGVVTRDGWKYVVFEPHPWLLFNLNEDPYEQVNLAYNSRYAKERRNLQARLAAWINDTGDAFKLPEP